MSVRTLRTLDDDGSYVPYTGIVLGLQAEQADAPSSRSPSLVLSFLDSASATRMALSNF